jgi:hypothetical protein
MFMYQIQESQLLQFFPLNKSLETYLPGPLIRWYTLPRIAPGLSDAPLLKSSAFGRGRVYSFYGGGRERTFSLHEQI